jgi:RNA polymerase sigma-70 factor (ECF subfamily)
LPAERQRCAALAHLSSVRTTRLDVPSARVVAAQAGDPLALAELVRSVWPHAYRVARTVVADHAGAEDVAQDACAQLLDALGALRDPERFTPWFFRIVVNAANGRLRKSGRDRLLEPATAPPERLSLDERLDLRRAIDALDRAARVAVVLRYYYDLSSAEIARVTQSTPVTVRWRLMRAHRRLRALLESPATVAPSYGDQRYADGS